MESIRFYTDRYFYDENFVNVDDRERLWLGQDLVQTVFQGDSVLYHTIAYLLFLYSNVLNKYTVEHSLHMVTCQTNFFVVNEVELGEVHEFVLREPVADFFFWSALDRLTRAVLHNQAHGNTIRVFQIVDQGHFVGVLDSQCSLVEWTDEERAAWFEKPGCRHWVNCHEFVIKDHFEAISHKIELSRLQLYSAIAFWHQRKREVSLVDESKYQSSFHLTKRVLCAVCSLTEDSVL